MKRTLVVAVVLAVTALAAFGARTGKEPESAASGTASAQSALLRVGMNLEVSERIRKGDIDGALRLLNTMNVLEITPMLLSPDDEQLAEMKRRVFRKLMGERSKLPPPAIQDEKAIQLNRDIDDYLKRYR